MIVVLGLIAGNFAYQWIFQVDPNWATAAERSLFQAIAVWIYWLFDK